ncbi:hypothetical protein PoB_002962000 [Plakobranchus ocellatus]|uniref:Uncharacterized protein n=1 Tax=Plakobranchus ocellatus TaxID=259542 RepID=A0AAV4A4Q6_9GAST|nr:hypothetical protein PoB_002962000 [Plakobranchus ocellatus]
MNRCKVLEQTVRQLHQENLRNCFPFLESIFSLSNISAGKMLNEQFGSMRTKVVHNKVISGFEAYLKFEHQWQARTQDRNVPAHLRMDLQPTNTLNE